MMPASKSAASCLAVECHQPALYTCCMTDVSHICWRMVLSVLPQCMQCLDGAQGMRVCLIRGLHIKLLSCTTFCISGFAFWVGFVPCCCTMPAHGLLPVPDLTPGCAGIMSLLWWWTWEPSKTLSLECPAIVQKEAPRGQQRTGTSRPSHRLAAARLVYCSCRIVGRGPWPAGSHAHDNDALCHTCVLRPRCFLGGRCHYELRPEGLRSQHPPGAACCMLCRAHVRRLYHLLLLSCTSLCMKPAD